MKNQPHTQTVGTTVRTLLVLLKIANTPRKQSETLIHLWSTLTGNHSHVSSPSDRRSASPPTDELMRACEQSSADLLTGVDNSKPSQDLSKHAVINFDTKHFPLYTFWYPPGRWLFDPFWLCGRWVTCNPKPADLYCVSGSLQPLSIPVQIPRRSRREFAWGQGCKSSQQQIMAG